ncbi:protein DOG1-like 4 [Cynara cardunculus var. scolymus]|uniref:DOG1 domain-containing protein n=1 Tax=Cynara cardunculus var. scolymus TaxID=59895 RepID=A0A103Y6E5_CYNCS|nr:protein DOG1-like 4 [Cynara cardunculus var. scolymus]KVI03370.1 DOG1 domain-containing protein [Cynara cardunculus var. scolymus]
MSITPPRTVGRSNNNVRSFENFLQGWLVRQEHYLEELRCTLSTSHQSKDEDLRDLISRVLFHYQQYYEEKSRIAKHDVFLVFSPPWFSPFERSFFWIAGVKPGLAFRVVGSSVEDMSEEQVERMEKLKAETRAEEKELGDELARIQEGLAAPPVFEVARRVAVEEECGEMDSVMETLRVEMESVLANADMLRTRTAEKVAKILTAVQDVKFLAALTELQLKIRMWGSHLSR